MVFHLFSHRRALLIMVCGSLVALFLMFSLFLEVPQGQAAGVASLDLQLEPFTSGLDRPTAIRHAGDDRLFVLEQVGRIRVVMPDGTLLKEPFLDITELVGANEPEQGLLGITFHPDYRRNGYFYLNYTDIQGDTVIARYVVSDDPNQADPQSEAVLFTVDQPYGNHNGGDLAFGPDGYLYIALGDGGGAGDPEENAQDLGTLLGKLVRIDVDEGDPYAIPADNPFASDLGAAPCGQDEQAAVCSEIWAYGLRNPWRFSFDRLTGDLYIGDVGQSAWEEINFQRESSNGGENYGWDRMEGPECYEPPEECDQSGLTMPVWYYDHSQGNAVTGGYLYRGIEHIAMYGHYIFADFVRGTLWSIRYEDEEWQQTGELMQSDNLSAFGEDRRGELYVGGFSGTIYRVTESSPTYHMRFPVVGR